MVREESCELTSIPLPFPLSIDIAFPFPARNLICRRINTSSPSPLDPATKRGLYEAARKAKEPDLFGADSAYDVCVWWAAQSEGGNERGSQISVQLDVGPYSHNHPHSSLKSIITSTMKRSLSPDELASESEELQVEREVSPPATAPAHAPAKARAKAKLADKKKGKHWPRKQVAKEGRSENENENDSVGDNDGHDHQASTPKATPKKAKCQQNPVSSSGHDSAGLGYPVSESP